MSVMTEDAREACVIWRKQQVWIHADKLIHFDRNRNEVEFEWQDDEELRFYSAGSLSSVGSLTSIKSSSLMKNHAL
jgi:hypothetical protein